MILLIAVFAIGVGFGFCISFTAAAYHWAKWDAAWEAYRIELNRRLNR